MSASFRCNEGDHVHLIIGLHVAACNKLLAPMIISSLMGVTIHHFSNRLFQHVIDISSHIAVAADRLLL